MDYKDLYADLQKKGAIRWAEEKPSHAFSLFLALVIGLLMWGASGNVLGFVFGAPVVYTISQAIVEG